MNQLGEKEFYLLSPVLGRKRETGRWAERPFHVLFSVLGMADADPGTSFSEPEKH